MKKYISECYVIRYTYMDAPAFVLENPDDWINWKDGEGREVDFDTYEKAKAVLNGINKYAHGPTFGIFLKETAVSYHPIK